MKTSGFTLIELLIVIAIILILIAIALPNFLEAQLRASVARAKADMKSLVIATEGYKNDWRLREPKTDFEPVNRPPFGYSEWWGFASHLLTTPVKFISSQPVDAFGDTWTLGFWTQNLRGKTNEAPYTVIRLTYGCHTWPIGGQISNNPGVVKAAGGATPIPRQFVEGCRKSGYIYYSSSTDHIDSTVWLAPAFYSPTNGTTSFGDIYEFGPGGPDQKEIKE
jgi:prepilin-type N-terminal cleavage/methylation domain-containing protein